jgi:hypothetical protein
MIVQLEPSEITITVFTEIVAFNVYDAPPVELDPENSSPAAVESTAGNEELLLRIT